DGATGDQSESCASASRKHTCASHSKSDCHKRAGGAGHGDAQSEQERLIGEAMKRLALLFAALLFISLARTTPAQETQPKREGAISGRAVADDGQPLAGAQATSLGARHPPTTRGTQMTACDAEGNFKVAGLLHGVVSLLARAPSYVSTQNQSLKYRIGESVIIHLARGGVITGRVIDEFGEPVVGVRVLADRVRDS